MQPPCQPASWTSLYGSLTISQLGKENPNGGMNEAGLVVEQTTLWESKYPIADRRPALGELHFIQYLLDTCRTVQEALTAARQIRIDQSTSNLHYLLIDRSGNHAIIEFLEGDQVVHTGELSAPVITNTSYQKAEMEIQRGNSDRADLDEYEQNSLDRFLVVSERLNTLKHQAADMDTMFEILTAAQRNDTVFSLVYNLDLMEIQLMTQRNQERITIRMDEFDFDVTMPAQAVDVQKLKPHHSRAQFDNYSAEINYEVVRGFFRDPILTSIFKWNISDEMLRFLADYPDTI